MVAGALCALALIVGGCELLLGSSAAAVFCQDAIGVDCDFAFRCYSDEERAQESFTSVFGASEAECLAKLESRERCGSQMVETACGGGGRFHSGTAAACITDAKAATCEQWRARTFPMTNCGGYCS